VRLVGVAQEDFISLFQLLRTIAAESFSSAGAETEAFSNVAKKKNFLWYKFILLL